MATASTPLSTDVLTYLQNSLPKEELLLLYTDRFVCRAVLQQLSPLAQQIILRLSCCGGQFDGVDQWSHQDLGPVRTELRKWGIFKEDTKIMSLTAEFLCGLQTSLLELDASPWTSLSHTQILQLEQEANEPYKPVTLEDLERYTQSQWDAVLHFLVGTVGQKEPPAAVVHFLLQTGLMQPDPDYKGSDRDNEAPLVITQEGYDFMLKENHQQVWHFVAQYLLSLESHKRGLELRKEALLLLLRLSFARIGNAYLTSDLGKDPRVMVKDLANFGLLYTRKIGKHTVFYPTRVALQLVGSTNNNEARWSLSNKTLESALAHPTPDSSHLAIIVQTNFQLCAYTTSELHVSMLGLFCEVQTIRRLPNVVFMSITRDSVKAAFGLGIQARQILRFLEKHAHPKFRATGSTIPENVMDQICLWDRERSRVLFREVYQHECLSPGESAAIMAYAKEKRVFVWSKGNLILIEYDFVQKVHSFCQKWRARVAARQSAAQMEE
jgi:transcription initiation factor TFIIH subunit 4